MSGLEAHAGATDSHLVGLAERGDRDAFATLYTRYQGAIFRFAFHMTGSPVAAEDIVHDVFVAFMTNLARFDAQRPLGAYLYGIARHMIARRLHRDRRSVSLDPNADYAQRAADATLAERLEHRDHVRRLRSAIIALPRRHREVIVLCDLHKLSYETASEALGCPVGTIRSRLHRARAALAALMHPATATAERLPRSRVGLAL